MAATEQNTSNASYYILKHRSICQESKDPREGFEPIEVRNPQTNATSTKYIKRYKDLSGHITAVDWYNREHEGTTYEGLKITMVDGDWTGVLDIPINQRACMSFLKLAENIDYSRPVSIAAWKARNQETHEEETAFVVRQNDVPVKWKYTREHPNGIPEPRKNARGKYDWSDVEAFLIDALDKRIRPMVMAAAIGDSAPSPSQAAVAAQAPSGRGVAQNVAELATPAQVIAFKKLCRTEGLDPKDVISEYQYGPDVEPEQLTREAIGNLIEKLQVPF